MKDFILFRKMLTPLLIQVMFWIGLVLLVFTGFVDMFSEAGFFRGLQIIIFGPILLRISCEILILFFRMNDTLTEIYHNSGGEPRERSLNIDL